MQWIDQTVKYIDFEAVKDYNRQTHKNTIDFNQEFTQYSWATSPGPTFSGGLSIKSSNRVLFTIVSII